MRGRGEIVVLAVMAVLAMPALSAPPPGADPDSPMGRWFRGLRIPTPQGGSCCDESDCVRTTARHDGQQWLAITPDGDEVPVPAGRILADKAHPAGAAVLCWRRAIGVICFVPPQTGG